MKPEFEKSTNPNFPTGFQDFLNNFPKMGQWKSMGADRPEKKLSKIIRESQASRKSVFPLFKVPAQKELNKFIGQKPDKDGWVKIKGVMDSGASESVAPTNMCPHYPILPSPGSIAGQNYISASDDLIPNLGEQLLNVVAPIMNEGQLKYQMADVTRPLNAVSEICDAGGPEGQYVIFSKHGGAIYNPESGGAHHSSARRASTLWSSG